MKVEKINITASTSGYEGYLDIKNETDEFRVEVSQNQICEFVNFEIAKDIAEKIAIMYLGMICEKENQNEV
jgi:hypothetical protein